MGAEDDDTWSVADREAWYDASQGSRLLPLSKFEALDRARLATSDQLDRFDRFAGRVLSGADSTFKPAPSQGSAR